jgi:hypothetical protein
MDAIETHAVDPKPGRIRTRKLVRACGSWVRVTINEHTERPCVTVTKFGHFKGEKTVRLYAPDALLQAESFIERRTDRIPA